MELTALPSLESFCLSLVEGLLLALALLLSTVLGESTSTLSTVSSVLRVSSFTLTSWLTLDVVLFDAATVVLVLDFSLLA